MAFLGDFTIGDEIVMHVDGDDNCLCVVVDDNRVEVVTDDLSVHFGKAVPKGGFDYTTGSRNLQTIASMVVERKKDGKKNLLSIHCWCLSLTEHVARKLRGGRTIPEKVQWAASQSREARMLASQQKSGS